MERSLSIGVVGAGTAGAASAILLGRAGHRVTVLECVDQPSAVGAGITLQPTGQAALRRLGLAELVEARATRIDRLCCVRRGGKVLVDLAYAEIDPRLYGLGIHRGVLFETLFAAARELATVRCGARVVGTDVDGGGRWLVDDRGERHGPFDLVIVADGAVCELHHAATRVRSRPYRWGALWFVGVDRDGALSSHNAILQTVDGARHMLGLLPTGTRTTGEHVVSLFWSIRGDRVDAWRAAGLAAWRDQLLPLDPRAEGMLDQVDDPGRVLFSRYHDVSMWPWHGDRIVFVGDAAHATSPQLGQGANLALCDAVELTDAIAAAPTVAEAIAAYSRVRRHHLKFYQFMTRALTPWFQSDSRAIGWFRDRLFSTSTWVRPLRRKMIRTMIGADRGLLRRPLPVAI